MPVAEHEEIASHLVEVVVLKAVWLLLKSRQVHRIESGSFNSCRADEGTAIAAGQIRFGNGTDYRLVTYNLESTRLLADQLRIHLPAVIQPFDERSHFGSVVITFL